MSRPGYGPAANAIRPVREDTSICLPAGEVAGVGGGENADNCDGSADEPVPPLHPTDRAAITISTDPQRAAALARIVHITRSCRQPLNLPYTPSTLAGARSFRP